ncbi:LacI family DNA-binding transcriptional regulator [Cohnella fermenti]|uniref:LacI family transcriptional regulator n=1 Tax=Cohnella fermenti TaxID=2565925 RepID=A0A4S4C3Q6_9BACL|nr:LacI family DNA-binding transcriptional regulator [Cohnella fermenti]THF80279.1 LacI family transcriptional regulator [Cohnella fermenti]
MKRPVTIRQVARRARVAPSTVSRVLSDEGRISEETRRRVRRALAELDYYPNSAARGLVNGASGRLGIMLSRTAAYGDSHALLPELLRGIGSRAARSGYDLLLASGESMLEELSSLDRLLQGKRVDGVVLFGSGEDDPLLDRLEESSLPFVRIGRHQFRERVPSVDTDNRLAAREAVRHLAELGHARIGFVLGPRGLTSSWDRLEGYEQALREIGVEPAEMWLLEGDGLSFGALRTLSLFLGQPNPPTALIVGDDRLGIFVLRTLVELRVPVPERLALVAFNSSSIADWTIPSLTSLDVGIDQIGTASVDLLLRLCEGEAPTPRSRIVPHRLVARESTLGVKPPASAP